MMDIMGIVLGNGEWAFYTYETLDGAAILFFKVERRKVGQEVNINMEETPPNFCIHITKLESLEIFKENIEVATKILQARPLDTATRNVVE